MTINEAITLANIARRALTLFDEGYRLRQHPAPHFFTVYSPTGAEYVVWTEGERCSCPSFQKHKTCKHLLAVKNELRREEMQANEYDALILQAETASGCDYAEF